MRAMDSTFTILGLTAHAYGLCASAAALVLLGGMAILARRRRMPAGLTGLFGLLGIPLGFFLNSLRKKSSHVCHFGFGNVRGNLLCNN